MKLFKGRVILTQYISRKDNHSGTKIYKLCNPIGYMKVYMGKERQGMTQHLTATHAKVTKLIRKQKDVATNCTWKISSPFLNFSMT